MTSKSGAFKMEEICAIIEACGKNGIKEFSYQGLKLSIGPTEPTKSAAPTTEPFVLTPEIKELAESQTREARVQDEIMLKKHELENMLIEDPDAYFEAIRRGDLVNEKGN